MEVTVKPDFEPERVYSDSTVIDMLNHVRGQIALRYTFEPLTELMMPPFSSHFVRVFGECTKPIEREERCSTSNDNVASKKVFLSSLVSVDNVGD